MALSLKVHEPHDDSDPLGDVALLTHPQQLEKREDILRALLRSVGVLKPDEAIEKHAPERIVMAYCAVKDRTDLNNRGGYCMSILRNAHWKLVDRRPEVFPHLYGPKASTTPNVKLQELPTPIEMPRGRIVAATPSTQAAASPKTTDPQPTLFEVEESRGNEPNQRFSVYSEIAARIRGRQPGA